MEILKAHDQSGWITARINGRWCQAKVYDEPSTYGINGGRVSKLCIAKDGVAELGVHTGLNFFDNIDFNYDRGLDFDNLPDGVLPAVIAALETLPKKHAE